MLELFSLTTSDLISVMDKMSPRSFARLRRSNKDLDSFAEKNRRQIGAYHDRKIRFKENNLFYKNGVVFRVDTIISTTNDALFALKDPFRSISGFSFRGIVLEKYKHPDSKKIIMEILKTTKKRFDRFDVTKCDTIGNDDPILKFIQPKILYFASLCEHSLNKFEGTGDIFESVTRETDKCPPPEDIYSFAANFRLVHLVAGRDILKKVILDWKDDREPRKLEWLKLELNLNPRKMPKTDKALRKRCSDAFAHILKDIDHREQFTQSVKFLDFGKKRPTICVSISRGDGQKALLGISYRRPTNRAFCGTVICIDFLPNFEGDFKTFSVESSHFPSMWTGYQLACRTVWPELKDDFNS